MPPKGKYTDPKLRDQVKEEVQASDKGGAPGQWSARKAQFMASEYKKRGGGYTTDKSQQDESQEHLDKWTEEEWQTKEGSGNAKKSDGTQKRYLPKKAWEQMDEQEKEETDQKKQEASKEGQQYVDNTSKAKNSRKKANQEEDEKKANEKKANGSRSSGSKSSNNKSNNNKSNKGNKDQGDGDAEFHDQGGAARTKDGNEAENTSAGTSEEESEGEEEFAEDDEVAEPDEDDEEDYDYGGEDDVDDESVAEEEDPKVSDRQTNKTGSKRKATEQKSNGAEKKQKSSNKSGGTNAPAGKVGSKHMDDKEPAQQGSASRLPKKGQQVTWKAMPGWVEGKVKEILTKGKKVDGKDVKASKNDPKIVLTSNSSGKVCVHKPDACYYD